MGKEKETILDTGRVGPVTEKERKVKQRIVRDRC